VRVSWLAECPTFLERHVSAARTAGAKNAGWAKPRDLAFQGRCRTTISLSKARTRASWEQDEMVDRATYETTKELGERSTRSDSSTIPNVKREGYFTLSRSSSLSDAPLQLIHKSEITDKAGSSSRPVTVLLLMLVFPRQATPSLAQFLCWTTLCPAPWLEREPANKSMR
jgi:hypothetical protein